MSHSRREPPVPARGAARRTSARAAPVVPSGCWSRRSDRSAAAAFLLPSSRRSRFRRWHHHGSRLLLAAPAYETRRCEGRSKCLLHGHVSRILRSQSETDRPCLRFHEPPPQEPHSLGHSKSNASVARANRSRPPSTRRTFCSGTGTHHMVRPFATASRRSAIKEVVMARSPSRILTSSASSADPRVVSSRVIYDQRHSARAAHLFLLL